MMVLLLVALYVAMTMFTVWFAVTVMCGPSDGIGFLAWMWPITLPVLLLTWFAEWLEKRR